MKNHVAIFVLILICLNYTICSKNKQIFDYIKQINGNKRNINNRFEKISRPVISISDSKSNSENDINFLEKEEKLTKRFEDNESNDNQETDLKESIKKEENQIEENNESEVDEKEDSDSNSSTNQNTESSYDQEKINEEILSYLKDIKKRLIKNAFERNSYDLINRLQKKKKQIK